jgi:hypothetical protein
VLVHVVQDEKVDDELLELVRTRKPYGATVIGLGDRTDVCEPDPFFEESLPAALVASIRATKEPKPLAPSCGPRRRMPQRTDWRSPSRLRFWGARWYRVEPCGD